MPSLMKPSRMKTKWM